MYYLKTRVAESVSDSPGCWRFLVGIGFLTTLGVGVGVGFFCPTPEVQLDHF